MQKNNMWTDLETRKHSSFSVLSKKYAGYLGAKLDIIWYWTMESL